jgi:hypothetical protein
MLNLRPHPISFPKQQQQQLSLGADPRSPAASRLMSKLLRQKKMKHAHDLKQSGLTWKEIN